MGFFRYVKYVLIDICEFLAIALWFAYLYFSLWSFINAAIAMNVVDVQKVSYVLYSLLFLLLPTFFNWSPSRLNKQTLLRGISIAYALVLLVGTVADFISFNFFIDYTFIEGDAVFVNLIMNMPNMGGAIICLIMAALYVAFGFTVTEKPVVAYIIFFSIFFLDAILPFLISLGIYGSMPRLTWIKKSLFLLPMQFLNLLALTLAVTSREYWRKIIY